MVKGSTSRIADELRAWVLEASPGDRLPPSRALTAQYGASPLTVQKALQILVGEGLVETRAGVGAFVRPRFEAQSADYDWQTTALGAARTRSRPLPAALRVATTDAIPLHSGYPDRALLPERLIRRAFSLAARSDTTLTRGPAAGLPGLRSWFATQLAHGVPAHLSPPAPEDVIVVPGSQSGLSIAFRALVGADRPLLLESPTYWGAILAAEQAGVRVVPVPTGPDGPSPQTLDQILGQTAARVFYAQPNFANPTGAQWSQQRREEILDVVRRHGAFLVEDDWAHDFGHDSARSYPIAPYDYSGNVVYLRSLTKSVSPAVRVAAVVARGPAKERILAATHADAMYVSPLLQEVALHVVDQPAWESHLRVLRRDLTRRRDLLCDALARHVPQAQVSVPSGGLNLWVRLPDLTSTRQLVRDCETEGVLVAAGDEWFPAERTGPHLRLNYAGADPENFGTAGQRIGRALRAQLERPPRD